tara:strand:+ start:2699 stop:5266 length:2568 start_codon:yes stop_codon:yes gene_type:complete
MQIHDKVAKDLYGVLAKKFTQLTIADSQAVTTVEPNEGRIFTLEYGASGKSHGSVTVNVVDPNALVIYYNNNITEEMRHGDKKDWYSFLKELRFFAKRNLMSFDVRNIGKQQLDKTDYAYIKNNDNAYDSTEVTFESKLAGTLKTSYQRFGENVRLIIKHSAPVDEDVRGSRSRNIHSLYVENVEQGRVKLPFKNLLSGRALAQHMNHNGSYQDEIGQHIHEITQEALDLAKFVKVFKRADNFAEQDEAQHIIEQARQRYQGIRETLKTLCGAKGYAKYVEQYRPTENNIEQADLDDIRSKLVRIQKDNIVDTILPNLARGINKMKVQEQEGGNAMAHDLAKDPSAKLDIRMNPEEDEDIKNYIQHLKKNVINKNTSENPEDGLVRKIIMTLAKRTIDDALSLQISDLASMDTPPDRQAAYQLASKYMKGNVNIIPGKRDLKAKTEEDQYESIMNNLSEGTWAIPDTAEAIDSLETAMADVLPLGAEGENATNVMYNIIGDDSLFDSLGEAADKDPQGDARPIIASWVDYSLDQYDIPQEMQDRIQEIVKPHLTHPSTNEEETTEGKVKNALHDDAEEMTREEFLAKHPDSEEFYDTINGVDEAMVPTEPNNENVAVNGADTEGSEEIADAIQWRITANPETFDKILKNVDMQTLLSAIEEVAQSHAPMDEIGSSDVSIMVKEVMKDLGINEDGTMQPHDHIKNSGITEATCGCKSGCPHCEGKHTKEQIGEECECCGNNITAVIDYDAVAEATIPQGKTEFTKDKESKLDKKDADKLVDLKAMMAKEKELEEAQSPAQKAAFEKMLAAKKGNKKDDKDDKEEVEEKVEEAVEVVAETPEDQHLRDEILFLAGLK